MEHVKDIELIEWVANRLDGRQAETLRRHLDGCPTCRSRLADLQSTWDVLGAWDVSTGAQRRAAESPSVLLRASPAAFRRAFRFPGMGVVLRIAASLIVAVLVGYTGGRRSVSAETKNESPGAPQYVSALGLEVGESFSSLVLQDEFVGGKEDG